MGGPSGRLSIYSHSPFAIRPSPLTEWKPCTGQILPSRRRAPGVGGSPVQGLVGFLRTLGAARLGAMAAVTVTLVGVFGFLILRVTAPQMTPLFTDLTVEDSTTIVKDLERQGIAYELKNDGAIVMVARDQVARVRMRLAEGGLPKGGGIGYEIFDKSDALGATSFVQNINHLRAMEGEWRPHPPPHLPAQGPPRPPGAAGAAAVLAREGRAVRLDRAQDARDARK